MSLSVAAKLVKGVCDNWANLKISPTRCFPISATQKNNQTQAEEKSETGNIRNDSWLLQRFLLTSWRGYDPFYGPFEK